MTANEPAIESPFWTWSDIAVFTGLALPCLLGGAAMAQMLGLVSHFLYEARAWMAMLMFYLTWFGCLFVLLKTRYNRSFWSSLGWMVPERGALLCLMSGPAVALTVGALGLLLKTPQKQLPIEKLLEGQFGLVLFGVFSVVLGPVTEELAFRGFLMPLAVRSLGIAPGIIVSALPFALLHGPEYDWTWQYVVLIGMAGALFGVARHYTRSTLGSALMHGTYNLTFFMALLAKRGAL